MNPRAWFRHIAFLLYLREGGYPFDKDDLTIEEWLDMGAMKQARERISHET